MNKEKNDKNIKSLKVGVTKRVHFVLPIINDVLITNYETTKYLYNLNEPRSVGHHPGSFFAKQSPTSSVALSFYEVGSPHRNICDLAYTNKTHGAILGTITGGASTSGTVVLVKNGQPIITVEVTP